MTRRTHIVGSSLTLLAMLALTGAAFAQGELLETNADSLITYLYNSPTPVQDVDPHDLQRVVNFDGTGRLGTGGLGARINANPFGSAWGSTATVSSIHLATGAWTSGIPGIALPADMPWGVSVFYNGQQAEGAHVSDGYQGRNWVQSSQPELVLFEETAGSGSNDGEDLVYIVFGNGRFAEFKRQSANAVAAEYDAFKGVNGVGGVVLFEEGATSEPDTYTLIDQYGQRFVFFGFDADAGAAAGQFWKKTGTGGDVAYVGHATTGSTAITSGYDGAGRITDAYDSEGRHFDYTYSSFGSAGTRLASVEAFDGATSVAKVEYDYYASAITNKGNTGDLMTVTVTTPLSESGRSTVDMTYLRYNTTVDERLKMVVGPYGTHEEPAYASASDADLKPLSDWFFDYDTNSKVTSLFTSGSCGCSGALDGTITFVYDPDGANGYPKTSGYDHEAAMIVDVMYPARASGALPLIQKVLMDETGQRGSTMAYASSGVLDNGASGPSEYWLTSVERDDARGTVVHVLPEEMTSLKMSADEFHDLPSTTGVRFREVATSTGPSALSGLPQRTDTKESAGAAKSGATTVYDSDSAHAVREDTVAGTVKVRRGFASSRTAPNDETTTHARVWHTGTYSAMREKKVTTERPMVALANNGGNAHYESHAYYREDGTMAFSEAADGRIDYTEIDGGLVRSRATDVTMAHTPANTEKTALGVTLPAAGANLVTTYSYDDQGRTTEVEGPTGRVAKTYWTDLDDDRVITLSIPRYVAGGTPTYHGPVSVTLSNKRGGVVASGTISFSGGSTTTAPSDWITHTATDLASAIAHGTLISLNETVYDASGARVTETRAYYDIDGTAGNQCDATTYAYDDLGRRVRTEDPTGTISRVVYDVRGRAIQQWTGTSDAGFTSPTTVGDMVLVSETEYDSGATNGPGLVTKRTAHVDATTTRVTEYFYDDANRLVATKNPEAPHSAVGYDTYDRVDERASFTSAATVDASLTPTSTTGRISYATTEYDEWGRAFKRVTHGVQRSGGSAGSLISPAEQLISLTWYDENGRAVKTRGSSISKVEHDSMGRAVRRYTLAADEDSTYAESVGGVQSDDIVVSQSQTVYDDDGRTVMTVSIDRAHDAPISGGSAVLGSLDSNADGDDALLTAADIEGRVSISCVWYDDLDRAVDRVSYGTADLDGAATSFSRPSAAPARSDTALRTTTVFEESGRVLSSTDPAGVETRYAYDDLGRRVTIWENYVDGTPGDAADNDDDRKTTYAFTDGLKTSMTAVDPDGADQTTTYTYGVPKGASGGQSDLASERMLYTVQYPDSSGGTDVVTYAYNRLGQQKWMRDQAGNVTETAFDDAGRATSRSVTTLKPGFDGSVRRIETAYNDLGQVTAVTQYDAATAGSVTDEVAYAYDDWGRLDTLEQDYNGAVIASGDQYTIEYSHDHRPYDRLSGSYTAVWEGLTTTGYDIVNPDATTAQSVTYVQGASGNLDDLLLRTEKVQVDITANLTVAEYDYLGVGRAVGFDLPEIDTRQREYDDADGSYDGHMDRFGRRTRDLWIYSYTKDSVDYDNTVIDRTIAYDRVSNIASVDHGVYGFDRDYEYDGLQRLRNEDRGLMVSGSVSTDRDEVWDLDQLGNWSNVKRNLNDDLDYTDTNELDKSGTFNAANEQTARGGTSHTYDAVGNFTDDGNSYAYKYDAFGRLIEVWKGTSGILAEYRYNGLGQRIGWHHDADADNLLEDSDHDPWTYGLYNRRWQLVAELEGDTSSGASVPDDPSKVFTHHHAGLGGSGGSSYIDAVIRVDADTNGDAVLNQRVYLIQNWRHDVVATSRFNGRMQWIDYTPYGEAIDVLAADFDRDGDVDATDYAVFTGGPGAEFGRGLPGGGPPCSTSNPCRSDFNRDGAVDLNDFMEILTEYNSADNDEYHETFVGLPDRAHGRGYAGYVDDAVFELYHVRHRAYLPEFGRWTRRDPMGYVDGGSLYQYVRSGAIGMMDAMGLCARCGSASLPSDWWSPTTPFDLPVSTPDDAPRPAISPTRKFKTLDPPYVKPVLPIPDSIRQHSLLDPSEARHACLDWAAKQRDQSWVSRLPDCPCTINVTDTGNPTLPGYAACNTWKGIEPRDGGAIPTWEPYHPGAEYQLRSRIMSDGSGQQCTYDARGKLITGGLASGTPDIYSPNYTYAEVALRSAVHLAILPYLDACNTLGGDFDTSIEPALPETVQQHRKYDVFPYAACWQAGLLDVYYRWRPPNQGADENGAPCPPNTVN